MPVKKDLETSDHVLCPKGRVGTFVNYNRPAVWNGYSRNVTDLKFKEM